MNDIKISASILSADFAKLGEEITAVLNAGADMVHFDVMDNHYVPNLTIGPMVCKALRNYGITAAIDVHLMVKPVDKLIEEFARAGATYITFHPDASIHIDRSLQLIRDLGCKSGLAFNPSTPLDALKYVKHNLDMILIMSVNPGFAGQQFIPHTLEKIQEAKQFIDKNKLTTRLEVDGGIKLDNISKIAQAGADTFVMGSAIFNGNNYQETLNSLRKQLQRS